ncbi:MAG: GNAT family N-acetyltransferase [Clostridia bacterium]|nr:GNAT family N-acetyltransferase [Clostridia bacterium]
MVEYVIGTIEEKDEIVDFINYVFSQAHRPHDFITLMPKSYGPNAKDLGAIHYMAKKDGKIKALVATRIISVNVCGKLLKYGLIGNVSVHPYSRGEGYMKQLMQMMLDDTKKRGVDILLLGGQRQRYGYFGFENAGAVFEYTVTKTNIRHCFGELDTSAISFKPLEDEIDFAKALYERNMFHAIREKDEFYDIMHTWGRECRIIMKNKAPIGYMYGCFDELILEDESDFPLVMKAIFETDNLDTASVTAAPFMTARAELLSEICEGSSVKEVKMINILNYESVLTAFFNMKSQLVSLQDGKADFVIDGRAFEISVTDGTPEIKKTDSVKDGAIVLTHKKAQEIFFSLKSLLLPSAQIKNWFPLPFMIDSPDGY